MYGITYDQWKEQMMRSAKKTRTPVCATFELTPRCNLDCKMCYIHNADSNALRDSELSTEEWKRIFDEAYDCGMMFAALTGGECLLRCDFKELYLHLWNKRVNLTVMTNGVLLNKEYLDFFRTYKPRLVRISLYGSCEEGYLQVTGHRGFEKAANAALSLREAGIHVQLSITPSSYIKDDYISILRFCKENRFQCNLGDFSLIESRNNPEKKDYYLSIDESVELATERARLFGTLTSGINPPAPCGTCTEVPKGLTCNAGNGAAMVSWDGRMCLCTAMPVSKVSLLETSYAEAWEKTKEAADEVLLGVECVGCPYDKLCPKCPSMRLTGLYTGHCKPEVCELTRRLVAAGVKKLEQVEKPCD